MSGERQNQGQQEARRTEILGQAPYLDKFTGPVPWLDRSQWKDELHSLGTDMKEELQEQLTPVGSTILIQALTVTGRDMQLLDKSIAFPTVAEQIESVLLCGYEIGKVGERKDINLFLDKIYRRLDELCVLSPKPDPTATKRFIGSVMGIGMTHRQQRDNRGFTQQETVQTPITGEVETLLDTSDIETL